MDTSNSVGTSSLNTKTILEHKNGQKTGKGMLCCWMVWLYANNSLSPFKVMKNASLRMSFPATLQYKVDQQDASSTNMPTVTSLWCPLGHIDFCFLLLNMYFYERHRFLQTKMVFHTEIKQRAFKKKTY